MSIDTHIQLRTPFSAQQVRAILVGNPALADLGLAEHPEWKEVAGKAVCIIVEPWAGEDHALIEDGFDQATVRCKTIPGRGEPGWEAECRVIAAILREVPGDVCMANQDAPGPNLLRLGDTVYIDPDGCRIDNLTDFGYTPGRVVTGIPARRE